MCFPPWLVNELAVVPRQIIKASSLVVAVVSLAALGDDDAIHACLASSSPQKLKIPPYISYTSVGGQPCAVLTTAWFVASNFSFHLETRLGNWTWVGRLDALNMPHFYFLFALNNMSSFQFRSGQLKSVSTPIQHNSHTKIIRDAPQGALNWASPLQPTYWATPWTCYNKQKSSCY